jgi:hypothetical protein
VKASLLSPLNVVTTVDSPGTMNSASVCCDVTKETDASYGISVNSVEFCGKECVSVVDTCGSAVCAW